MRKRVTVFRTLSIGIGYQAQTVMTAVNNQIFQPVVTVTPSEVWNQRVTVINIYIWLLADGIELMLTGNLLPRERLSTVRKIRLLRVKTWNIVGDWIAKKPDWGIMRSTSEPRLRGAFHGRSRIPPFGRMRRRKLCTTNRSIFLACQGSASGGCKHDIKIHQHYKPTVKNAHEKNFYQFRGVK